MPTTIGANTVTAISRRLILPRVTDNIYISNPLFFRWWRANKMAYQGGIQITVPLMYKRMAAGGWYKGYQTLNVAPSDTVQNAKLTWKQVYVPVTVDGLTLLRADSPLAIADYLAVQFKQSEMEMATIIGTGLWSTGSTNLEPTGLQKVVDNGTVSTSYGGISHSANPWWNSQIDSTTTTLTLTAMQKMWGSCQQGGRAPTILFGTQANYNRYWKLNTAFQQLPVAPAGRTVQLAQAGFENLLFNGAPFLVDNHIPANNIFFLNEAYFTLVVASRAQFKIQDFQTPVNQDAMTSLLLSALNLTCANISRQGRMTDVQH